MNTFQAIKEMAVERFRNTINCVARSSLRIRLAKIVVSIDVKMPRNRKATKNCGMRHGSKFVGNVPLTVCVASESTGSMT